MLDTEIQSASSQHHAWQTIRAIAGTSVVRLLLILLGALALMMIDPGSPR